MTPSKGRNRVGIVNCGEDTQGSSFLATLGFVAESLWDSEIDQISSGLEG
jgi:hypothetical protein